VSDTAFLLTFLRTRYFAQLEARELLEKFLSRRSKLSKWFRNLDTTDPKILAVISNGYYTESISQPVSKSVRQSLARSHAHALDNSLIYASA